MIKIEFAVQAFQACIQFFIRSGRSAVAQTKIISHLPENEAEDHGKQEDDLASHRDTLWVCQAAHPGIYPDHHGDQPGKGGILTDLAIPCDYFLISNDLHVSFSCFLRWRISLHPVLSHPRHVLP